jgi:ABC-type uncharacterized transport system involved in gliding motility auxiliary subunit
MMRLAKKHEALLYSAVGLAALFFILVAFNYLAAGAAVRADLTAGNLYTLSAGTKKVLKGLQAPVKVRLYISSGEAMPVPLRGFAQRAQNLVEEFKAVAGPNLVIERYDPRPDSEQEDAALLDGIEPQQLMTGEQFYLGVAVSQLERKQTLPVLAPARERLLEYDLIRAIARAGSAERPRIGLMSGLPVLGEKFNPYTRQSAEPWVLANELRRDFDVQPVDLSATSPCPYKLLGSTPHLDGGSQATPNQSRRYHSPKGNRWCFDDELLALVVQMIVSPTLNSLPQIWLWWKDDLSGKQLGEG